MRLGSENDETNVEDRREQSTYRRSGGGLKLGLGGTVVVLLLSVVLKRNLFSELSGVPQIAPGEVARGTSAPSRRVQAEDELKRVAVGSFNDAQQVWEGFLHKTPTPYRPAKLVLFWDQTQSGCGAAGAEVGPFYCPADEKVYIDLSFYRELASQFGAPGDFAQAYVIAHEVGHHLQNVLGIERKMRLSQQREPTKKNQLSIQMELQADCFAGVWSHSANERKLLEAGDIDEGLGATAAVGDDHLQKQAQGRVTPETWTHGSAAQRSHWFKRGFTSGRVDDCDTFSSSAL